MNATHPIVVTVSIAGLAEAPISKTIEFAAQQPTVPGTHVQGQIALSDATVSAVARPAKQTADLRRVHLQDFLVKQAGRFVGLDFVKVDGSDRSLSGRLGVRKHLKGGTSTVSGSDRPYLVVYDVKAKGYRAVNLETVSVVRAQNTVYTILG